MPLLSIRIPASPDGKSNVYVEPLLSHRLSNEGGLNLPCLVE